METQVLGAAQQIDFSIWALFLRATPTVKAVMLVLLAASVWSWAIYLHKIVQFRRARTLALKFDNVFWSGEPMDVLYTTLKNKPRTPSERIFVAAMREWERSYDTDGRFIAGMRDRVDRAIGIAVDHERAHLMSGLAFLATVGSTGPFIGLFGTVWGIKHAFEQIALQQNTNLAVVAPGIAEALLATGLGLLAAIPAVVFFNQLSGAANRITGLYETLADEFTMILSREVGA